jgi:DNA transformation protein
MTASAEYTEYVLDFLEPLFPSTIVRFFGGAGVYFDTVQFAMIMDNTLYFAVDEGSRQKYEQAGMQPFSYMTKRGRVQVRKYFELPEDELNVQEQLKIWANESIQVAYNTKKSKRKPE